MSLPTVEELSVAAMSGGFVMLSNWGRSRPVYSRAPLIALATVGGYFAGSYLSALKHRKVVEREVALWHYIKTHPDDFPDEKPKKYRDVLEEWLPIR